jgi:hypothetical protein
MPISTASIGGGGAPVLIVGEDSSPGVIFVSCDPSNLELTPFVIGYEVSTSPGGDGYLSLGILAEAHGIGLKMGKSPCNSVRRWPPSGSAGG